jgi:hypothetical protein
MKVSEIDENVTRKERVTNCYRMMFGKAESMGRLGIRSGKYV